MSSSFLYRFGFAIVNWLEATVELFLLGQVSLGWVMNYAAWYTLRKRR
jgi:hypothetical protein